MNPPIQGRTYPKDGKGWVVTLSYPRVNDNPVFVEVELEDVRAADSLLISYDFDRDGYIIKQAKRFTWEADEECDPQWTEVAFIPAWQLGDYDDEIKCFK